MSHMSQAAGPLLQAGLFMSAVLLAQVVAVRHLSTDAIPVALRGRTELSNRLRPWLLVAAVLMSVAGLLLTLA